MNKINADVLKQEVIKELYKENRLDVPVDIIDGQIHRAKVLLESDTPFRNIVGEVVESVIKLADQRKMGSSV